VLTAAVKNQRGKNQLGKKQGSYQKRNSHNQRPKKRGPYRIKAQRMLEEAAAIARGEVLISAKTGMLKLTPSSRGRFGDNLNLPVQQQALRDDPVVELESMWLVLVCPLSTVDGVAIVHEVKDKVLSQLRTRKQAGQSELWPQCWWQEQNARKDEQEDDLYVDDDQPDEGDIAAGGAADGAAGGVATSLRQRHGPFPVCWSVIVQVLAIINRSADQIFSTPIVDFGAHADGTALRINAMDPDELATKTKHGGHHDAIWHKLLASCAGTFCVIFNEDADAVQQTELTFPNDDGRSMGAARTRRAPVR
jgi:hypothetical protein